MLSDKLREEFSALLHTHVPDLRITGVNATGRVPWREDEHPSFSADLEKAVWYDLARKEGGGVKEFKARLGLSGVEQQRKIIAVYPYYDEQKNLLFEVVRYEPKSFTQRRPDLNGKWIYNLNGARRVLYHLPRLVMAETVYVVEGEKDADTLWSLGLPATTNPQGAGKWRAEYSESLHGKKVVILPDNDQPGEQHAQAVARSLLGKASAIKIVRLPGLPPKGDVSDWLNTGHTKDELTAIIKATPILKPEDLSSKHKAQSSSPVLTRLSDVISQKVHWLWPGRIPLGKVTVLDGDPGLGKSLISIDLTARVTTARTMPDGSLSDVSEPAGVVILSAEDDLSDTIRPRLDAAEADTARVVHLTGVTEGDGQRLPDLADLDAIRHAIEAVSAKLVIVDPLMAYLPGQTDSHRDQDVRRNLAPLAALATETGVAVLVVRHLNKSGGKNPLYRGGGSIGIIGAARSGLLVAADPEDETGERRVLVSTKSNLAKASIALAYHISVTAENVAHVEWEGQSEHTATSLLAQPLDEDRSALDEAKDFLREVLADEPVLATEVIKQAGQAGISKRTLDRAKTVLKVITRKQGGFFSKDKPRWVWLLPGQDAAEGCQDMQNAAEDCQKEVVGNLQQSSEKNTRKFNGVTEDRQEEVVGDLQVSDGNLQREQEGEL